MHVNASISSRDSLSVALPVLSGCSPLSSDDRSNGSVFWYSEVELLPEATPQLVADCCLRAAQHPCQGCPDGENGVGLWRGS